MKTNNVLILMGACILFNIAGGFAGAAYIPSPETISSPYVQVSSALQTPFGVMSSVIQTGFPLTQSLRQPVSALSEAGDADWLIFDRESTVRFLASTNMPHCGSLSACVAPGTVPDGNPVNSPPGGNIFVLSVIIAFIIILGRAHLPRGSLYRGASRHDRLRFLEAGFFILRSI